MKGDNTKINRAPIGPAISWSGHSTSFAGGPGSLITTLNEALIQNAPDTAQVAPPNPRWKKRILLVDDDEQVLTSISLVLQEQHYEVIMASDGYEAMIKCQHYQPDLVLMDLNMPRLDGWKTIEAIDRLEPLVPIIVITARPQQYERAVGSGVDAFMEKPLDFPVLLDAVERLLNEASTQRMSRIASREFKTLRLGSTGGRG